MPDIVDVSDVLLELGLSSSATDEERALATQAIVRAEGLVKRFLRYDPVQRTRTEYYPQQNYGAAGSAFASQWEVNDTEAYTRQMVGGATSELFTQHLPLRSVTSLYIDYDARNGTRAGAWGASTLKVEGTDYWPNYDGVDSSGAKICKDGIIRSHGLWPTEAGCVKLTAVAGYSTAEFRGTDTIIDASPIFEVVLDEAVNRTRKALLMKRNSRIGHLAGPITSENLGDYSYTMDSSLIKTLFGSGWELTGASMMKLQSFQNFGWSLAS